jgi:hypothetical protein
MWLDKYEFSSEYINAYRQNFWWLREVQLSDKWVYSGSKICVAEIDVLPGAQCICACSLRQRVTGTVVYWIPSCVGVWECVGGCRQKEGMGLTSGCPHSRRFSGSMGRRPDLSSSLGSSMLEEICSHFCVLEMFPFVSRWKGLQET